MQVVIKFNLITRLNARFFEGTNHHVNGRHIEQKERAKDTFYSLILYVFYEILKIELFRINVTMYLQRVQRFVGNVMSICLTDLYAV